MTNSTYFEINRLDIAPQKQPRYGLRRLSVGLGLGATVAAAWLGVNQAHAPEQTTCTTTPGSYQEVGAGYANEKATEQRLRSGGAYIVDMSQLDDAMEIAQARPGFKVCIDNDQGHFGREVDFFTRDAAYVVMPQEGQSVIQARQ
jgi:hypothetical protein